MPFTNWGKEYEIGVAEMDQQHKKWIELLNKFYDSIDKGDVKSVLGKLVDEAIRYTAFHFAQEEQFMEKIKYPKLSQQRAMHVNMVETLKSYKKMLQEDKSIVSTVVTTEMKKWFNVHIRIEDRQYADYFLSRKK